MLPKNLETLVDYVGWADHLKQSFSYVIAILVHDFATNRCTDVWIFDQIDDTVASAVEHVARRSDLEAAGLVIIQINEPQNLKS